MRRGSGFRISGFRSLTQMMGYGILTSATPVDRAIGKERPHVLSLICVINQFNMFGCEQHPLYLRSSVCWCRNPSRFRSDKAGAFFVTNLKRTGPESATNANRPLPYQSTRRLLWLTVIILLLIHPSNPVNPLSFPNNQQPNNFHVARTVMKSRTVIRASIAAMMGV